MKTSKRKAMFGSDDDSESESSDFVDDSLSDSSSLSFASDDSKKNSKRKNQKKKDVKAPLPSGSSKKGSEKKAVLIKKETPASKDKGGPESKKADLARGPITVMPVLETVYSTSDDFSKGDPIATESQAKKVILAYMQQQNRPYSAIQVFDNLHQRIAKAAVQRILDTLSDGSSRAGACPLRCKEYGKAKIYFMDQTFLENETSGQPGNDSEKLICSETNIAILRKDCEGLKSEINRLHAINSKQRLLLDTLKSEPNVDELPNITNGSVERVNKKKKRIAEIRQLSAGLADESGQGKKRVTAEFVLLEHNFYRSQWKERKEKCTNFIELMLESSETKMKPKAMMETIGIDTDETLSLLIPPLLQPQAISKRTR